MQEVCISQRDEYLIISNGEFEYFIHQQPENLSAPIKDFYKNILKSFKQELSELNYHIDKEQLELLFETERKYDLLEERVWCWWV